MTLTSDFGGTGERAAPDDLQDDVRNAGAQWSDQEVVRDANLVSSRKPDDIPAFNKEMIRLFSESSQRPRDQQRAASGR